MEEHTGNLIAEASTSSVSVKNLSVGKAVEQNYLISDNFIFLEKDLAPDEEDLRLFKKWHIRKVETKSYSQSEKKFKIYFKEQIQQYRQFTKRFTTELQEFYNSIHLGYKVNMPNFDSHFETLLKFYDNPSNFFLFFINTELNSKNYEDVALLTAYYSLIIGSRMSVSKSDMRLLFYASLLADISFQQKSEKSALTTSESMNNKKFTLENLGYIAFHIRHSCDILRKELKASKELIYLVLLQHSYLDGTGLFKTNPDKISLPARILTVAHEFVYLSSQFLESFRKPLLPTNAMLHLLKHPERYDANVVRNFLAVNSFFPPGEVFLLSNKKPAICVKPTYRYPMRPLIELVVKDKKVGVSPTETINLAEEKLEIIALIDKFSIRKKFIKNIYRGL